MSMFILQAPHPPWSPTRGEKLCRAEPSASVPRIHGGYTPMKTYHNYSLNHAQVMAGIVSGNEITRLIHEPPPSMRSHRAWHDQPIDHSGSTVATCLGEIQAKVMCCGEETNITRIQSTQSPGSLHPPTQDATHGKQVVPLTSRRRAHVCGPVLATGDNGFHSSVTSLTTRRSRTFEAKTRKNF